MNKYHKAGVPWFCKTSVPAIRKHEKRGPLKFEKDESDTADLLCPTLVAELIRNEWESGDRFKLINNEDIYEFNKVTVSPNFNLKVEAINLTRFAGTLNKFRSTFTIDVIKFLKIVEKLEWCYQI